MKELAQIMIPTADEDVEGLEFSCIAVNGTTILENSLTTLLTNRIKKTMTMWLNNPTPRYLH